MPWHSQNLADQLSLSLPEGADYARQITTGNPQIFRPSFSPAKWYILTRYHLRIFQQLPHQMVA